MMTMSLAKERPPAWPREVDPAAAMRGFFAIMEAWDVRSEDARALLGAPPPRTYYAWRAGHAVRVSADTLRRIGYVAGIFKALELLYSDPHLADGWVKRPNRAFGGQSPLERMRAGDVTDLAAVRSYLDSARTPWS
ncbi:MAG: MbcA/ParS/Xre antitoxin family protein [Acetobacteraceae bacterium]